MKLKLLLTFLMLFALKGFSQAEAYPVPDLIQCNNEIFDLTVNTPVALGNQDPAIYTVTYYESQQDAVNNTNAITNLTQYVPDWWGAAIFYRVSNTQNDDYDISSFTLMVGSTFVSGYDDVITCNEPYVLPELYDPFSYYTGPGGTGTILTEGSAVTVNSTIYVYSELGDCIAEDSFTVTIGLGFTAQQPTPLYVCDGVADGIFTANLHLKVTEIIGMQQNAAVLFYLTEMDAQAGVNPIPNAWAYTHSQPGSYTLYVRAFNTTAECFTVVPLQVMEQCTGNEFTGIITYDINGDGCGTGDMGAAGIPVTYTSGNYFATAYTNVNGEYAFYNLPDGTGTVSIQQGTTFTVTPASQSVTFPGNTAEYDFCFSAPNAINDVGVVIAPVTAAQTGFDAYYNVYYVNNGTLPASGTITLQFDNANLTYVSSSPSMAVSGNTLTLPYNLMPFATDYVSITFNVSGPNGVTMGGTQLNFTATIDPVTGDAYPNDNINTFTQFVVNSWDPNDITVHEGETIAPEDTDEYLHYTIRFQNEGNANAVNIVVENPIDANLDLSTFEPIGASHSYTTMVEDGVVKFTFSNINLTWADNDEPGSHGHVTYRIKPAATVGLNDSMQGGVTGIYFDFNPAILTNTVTTTVQSTMAIADFRSNGIVMYPNPASDIVTFQLSNVQQNNIDVAVANVMGKTVLHNTLAIANSAATIDVSTLQSGVYFVTLTSAGKSLTGKLVIK